MNQPTRLCSKAIVPTHVLGAEVLWRQREDRLQRLIIRNLRFSKPNSPCILAWPSGAGLA